MFIDLVNFTGLSEQLDLDDLLALQSRYQQLALGVMERFGGFVASFPGDGILVYFGYPTAHGNDAERALRAGLEMTERLDKLDLRVSDGTPTRLAARIGVHTGLVIVGPEFISSGPTAHAVVGEAANLAARLQNEAPPGGVVVSSETRGLTEGLFDFLPMGARSLKGISRAVDTFQVIKTRPAAQYEQRALPSSVGMVGREQALSVLLSNWKLVCEQSTCQLLAVVGDAGIGKTRLVNEFFSDPALGSVNVVQAQCHEIFANTALFPVANFLWKRAGLTPEDDDGVRGQKLTRLLAEFDLANTENLQILSCFPGLTTAVTNEIVSPTPHLLKLKQYRLMVTILDRVARSRPTVLSIEDVHWLDPSSSELLFELVAALRDTPLLILVTARSFPKGPALPLSDQIVNLEELGLDKCFELANRIPGAENVPQALLEQAVNAADGVPLFVEQLVLSLIDESKRDSIRRRKGTDLPLILAEMLSERLDRRPGGRRIVQAAACLGRSFRPEFLAALLEEDAQRIVELLEMLVEAEILQPKRYGLELQYEFRHSLLQRMARDSMVESERRAMHSKMARVLQANDVPPIPEVLAYHLSEAGNFVDAIRAWLAAGLNSARQSAHVEAIDHLRKGVSLLPKLPDEVLRRELEISLQVALISSLSITQFATSMELSACGERGLLLCRDLGPTPMVFPFIFAQFSFANCRGNLEDARSQADLFLSLAEDGRYESGIVIGHRLRGMWLLGQGDAAGAKSELEKSLALYSHERDAISSERFGQNPRVHSQSLLALANFCLGNVEEALLLGRDTLLAADALRHPHSTALALCYVGGLIFGFCEASEHLARQARQLIALSEQHKLDGYRPHAMAFLGWALCQSGELERGIEYIERAVKAFDSVEYRLGVAGHLANLADAQRKVGRLVAAKASSTRAIEMTFASANGWLAPEVLRVDALIDYEAAVGNADAAIERLGMAVQRARHLGSPVFERRCLSSLLEIGDAAPNVETEKRMREMPHLANLKDLVESTVGRIGTLCQN